MLHNDHDLQLLLVRERTEQLRLAARPVQGRWRLRRIPAAKVERPACATSPSAV